MTSMASSICPAVLMTSYLEKNDLNGKPKFFNGGKNEKIEHRITQISDSLL